MSERADHDRTMRRLWAAKGSSHDRVVRLLRYGLPLVIGVIAAVLVFSPFTQRTEISFLLAKDKVDMASERMKVTRAEYRGQDSKGQPFALLAGSAVQKSSAEPIVRMQQLSGAIRLADGPATIAAAEGQYDMDSETVSVPGTVKVRSADGYAIDASNVAIDLKNRTADMLLPPEEIERRRAALGPSRDYVPESQTPWQEIHRDLVGQFDTGAVLENAVKYQRIAQTKGLPRDSH